MVFYAWFVVTTLMYYSPVLGTSLTASASSIMSVLFSSSDSFVQTSRSNTPSAGLPSQAENATFLSTWSSSEGGLPLTIPTALPSSTVVNQLNDTRSLLIVTTESGSGVPSTVSMSPTISVVEQNSLSSDLAVTGNTPSTDETSPITSISPSSSMVVQNNSFGSVTVTTPSMNEKSSLTFVSISPLTSAVVQHNTSSVIITRTSRSVVSLNTSSVGQNITTSEVTVTISTSSVVTGQNITSVAPAATTPSRVETSLNVTSLSPSPSMVQQNSSYSSPVVATMTSKGNGPLATSGSPSSQSVTVNTPSTDETSPITSISPSSSMIVQSNSSGSVTVTTPSMNEISSLTVSISPLTSAVLQHNTSSVIIITRTSRSVVSLNTSSVGQNITASLQKMDTSTSGVVLPSITSISPSSSVFERNSSPGLPQVTTQSVAKQNISSGLPSTSEATVTIISTSSVVTGQNITSVTPAATTPSRVETSLNVTSLSASPFMVQQNSSYGPSVATTMTSRGNGPLATSGSLSSPTVYEWNISTSHMVVSTRSRNDDVLPTTSISPSSSVVEQTYNSSSQLSVVTTASRSDQMSPIASISASVSMGEEHNSSSPDVVTTVLRSGVPLTASSISASLSVLQQNNSRSLHVTATAASAREFSFTTTTISHSSSMITGDISSSLPTVTTPSKTVTTPSIIISTSYSPSVFGQNTSTSLPVITTLLPSSPVLQKDNSSSLTISVGITPGVVSFTTSISSPSLSIVQQNTSSGFSLVATTSRGGVSSTISMSPSAFVVEDQNSSTSYPALFTTPTGGEMSSLSSLSTSVDEQQNSSSFPVIVTTPSRSEVFLTNSISPSSSVAKRSISSTVPVVTIPSRSDTPLLSPSSSVVEQNNSSGLPLDSTTSLTSSISPSAAIVEWNSSSNQPLVTSLSSGERSLTTSLMSPSSSIVEQNNSSSLPAVTTPSSITPISPSVSVVEQNSLSSRPMTTTPLRSEEPSTMLSSPSVVQPNFSSGVSVIATTPSVEPSFATAIVPSPSPNSPSHPVFTTSSPAAEVSVITSISPSPSVVKQLNSSGLLVATTSTEGEVSPTLPTSLSVVEQSITSNYLVVSTPSIDEVPLTSSPISPSLLSLVKQLNSSSGLLLVTTSSEVPLTTLILSPSSASFVDQGISSSLLAVTTAPSRGEVSTRISIVPSMVEESISSTLSPVITPSRDNTASTSIISPLSSEFYTVKGTPMFTVTLSATSYAGSQISPSKTTSHINPVSSSTVLPQPETNETVSDEFQVQVTLLIPRYVELDDTFIVELEQKLANVYDFGANRYTSRKRRALERIAWRNDDQLIQLEENGSYSRDTSLFRGPLLHVAMGRTKRYVANETTVKILNATREGSGESVRITFYVVNGGEVVKSNQAQKTMNAISDVEIVAELGYQVASRFSAVETTDVKKRPNRDETLLIVLALTLPSAFLLLSFLFIRCMKNRHKTRRVKPTKKPAGHYEHTARVEEPVDDNESAADDRYIRVPTLPLRNYPDVIVQNELVQAREKTAKPRRSKETKETPVKLASAFENITRVNYKGLSSMTKVDEIPLRFRPVVTPPDQTVLSEKMSDDQQSQVEQIVDSSGVPRSWLDKRLRMQESLGQEDDKPSGLEPGDTGRGSGQGGRDSAGNTLGDSDDTIQIKANIEKWRNKMRQKEKVIEKHRLKQDMLMAVEDKKLSRREWLMAQPEIQAILGGDEPSKRKKKSRQRRLRAKDQTSDSESDVQVPVRRKRHRRKWFTRSGQVFPGDHDVARLVGFRPNEPRVNAYDGPAASAVQYNADVRSVYPGRFESAEGDVYRAAPMVVPVRYEPIWEEEQEPVYDNVTEGHYFDPFVPQYGDQRYVEEEATISPPRFDHYTTSSSLGQRHTNSPHTLRMRETTFINPAFEPPSPASASQAAFYHPDTAIYYKRKRYPPRPSAIYPGAREPRPKLYGTPPSRPDTSPEYQSPTTGVATTVPQHHATSFNSPSNANTTTILPGPSLTRLRSADDSMPNTPRAATTPTSEDLLNYSISESEAKSLVARVLQRASENKVL